MKYKFVIEHIYGCTELVMCFEEKYKMLNNIFNEGMLLDLDIKEEWLNAIDDTVKGELVNGDFGVQSGFGAEVGKEKTIIYCEFTDEEIEISTERFKKISEIWFATLEEFEKTGHIKIKEGIID